MDNDDIRTRFAAIDTSVVADILDEMGRFDQGLSADFGPYPASAGKLAGWAYTVRGQMVPYEGTGDAAKMEAANGSAWARSACGAVTAKASATSAS